MRAINCIHCDNKVGACNKLPLRKFLWIKYRPVCIDFIEDEDICIIREPYKRPNPPPAPPEKPVGPSARYIHEHSGLFTENSTEL